MPRLAPSKGGIDQLSLRFYLGLKVKCLGRCPEDKQIIPLYNTAVSLVSDNVTNKQTRATSTILRVIQLERQLD